jgi:hypothetical protein
MIKILEFQYFKLFLNINISSTYEHRRNAGDLPIGNKTFEAVQSFQYLENIIGNLLTPWSRVLLEKLTSKLRS